MCVGFSLLPLGEGVAKRRMRDYANMRGRRPRLPAQIHSPRFHPPHHAAQAGIQRN